MWRRRKGRLASEGVKSVVAKTAHASFNFDGTHRTGKQDGKADGNHDRTEFFLPLWRPLHSVEGREGQESERGTEDVSGGEEQVQSGLCELGLDVLYSDWTGRKKKRVNGAFAAKGRRVPTYVRPKLPRWRVRA